MFQMSYTQSTPCRTGRQQPRPEMGVAMLGIGDAWKTGVDAIQRFLNNAQTCEVARRIKLELKAILKEHQARQPSLASFQRALGIPVSL
jgi:hypothetical protein